MAKKSNLPDARAYAKEIAERIGVAQGRILAIFEEALHEASLIATLVDFDQERAFLFDDYPLTKKRADVLVRTLSRRMLSEVTSAVSYAWGRADAKNDALELAIRGSVTATRREKALAAFLARKEGGMDLSGRVWRTSMQAKSEMELALDLGLRQGKDSAALSRDLRAYLREPERLFRRVRDAHGQLRLSQSAAAYHPGHGVYRSGYKNALRLTATETNIAYRTADYQRVQAFDFVRGVRVHLSENHTLNGKPFHCICDDFAGDYPKDFKFTGWHPQCRCYTTTILADDPDDPEATPLVESVPAGLSDWVADNGDRISASFERGKPAFWLRDNADQLGITLKKKKGRP